MEIDFTESEIQNICQAANKFYNIIEKIELRKDLELKYIDWYKKDDELAPEKQISIGKIKTQVIINLQKKYYIEGA